LISGERERQRERELYDLGAHKTQKQNKTSFFNVFLHFLFIAECRTSFFNAAGNIFAIYIDYLRANLETKPEKKPKDNRKWRNLPHNNNKSNEAVCGREKATACQKKEITKKKSCVGVASTSLALSAPIAPLSMALSFFLLLLLHTHTHTHARTHNKQLSISAFTLSFMSYVFHCVSQNFLIQHATKNKII